MEECGGGAAVEQLTARGMLSIPAMGAIAVKILSGVLPVISIPAMGAIAQLDVIKNDDRISIPAMGGAIAETKERIEYDDNQSPQWGAIDQDYVGRFHYNRKRQLCQARPHLTCTNRTSLKERASLLIPNS